MQAYLALYKGNKITVDANTTHEAQRKAAQQLRVRAGREHEVSVFAVDRKEISVAQLPSN